MLKTARRSLALHGLKTGLVEGEAVTSRFRVRLLVFAVFATALCSCRPVMALDDLTVEAVQMKRVEAAIDHALEYLARNQALDGSWPSWSGKNNAINAVALLAFLGRGHLPGRGPYQPVVDRALTFIVATQTPQGLFRSPNASRIMYEHGLATLAVIEGYGYVPSPEVRRSAQRGVDLIVKAQNATGGWRYSPTSQDADLSVTVMQVVALRAARNARLIVPEETIAKAAKYVHACANKGGFCYQPGGSPSVAQTAAGTLSMQLLGRFDDPTVKAGLEFLKRLRYGPHIGYFFYTNYYAMQANFQAGGEYWEHWHPQARKWFLENQNEDGSWPGVGAEAKFNGKNVLSYSTAMSTICLEVYLHYLPAYQR
ncbi:MAG: terpene cyclase/mutase family protein [Lentisphaerae bacterium]|nr:terpene cyclase/mutase family protein [Lentisphaerota bacterium]